jgi:hypothetical protein
VRPDGKKQIGKISIATSAATAAAFKTSATTAANNQDISKTGFNNI